MVAGESEGESETAPTAPLPDAVAEVEIRPGGCVTLTDDAVGTVEGDPS